MKYCSLPSNHQFDEDFILHCKMSMDETAFNFWFEKLVGEIGYIEVDVQNEYDYHLLDYNGKQYAKVIETGSDPVYVVITGLAYVFIMTIDPTHIIKIVTGHKVIIDPEKRAYESYRFEK